MTTPPVRPTRQGSSGSASDTDARLTLSTGTDDDEYSKLKQETDRLKQLIALQEQIIASQQKTGNTQGKLAGETASANVPANAANPSIYENKLDNLQLSLDGIGLIPGYGEIADLANAGISLGRGDYVGAALSVGSMIPFAGWGFTGAKAARKGARALEAGEKVAESTAKKLEREAAEKLEEKAEREAAEAAQKGKDGGKIKKGNSKEKGRCGEWLAKLDMMAQGFDEVISVQNNSGHGIDLIGRNSKTGEVKVWEVKTTDGTTAPSLSDAQKDLGGKDFTTDRLNRAAKGKGNYGKVPQAMQNAEQAKDWIRDAKGKVSHEKREVFVDDLDKGCMKHPKRPSKSKPW